MRRREFLRGGSAMLVLAILGLEDAMSAPQRKVGVAYDPIFLEHILAEGHPETPLRYQAIIEGFERRGLLQQTAKIDLLNGVEVLLASVHSDDHIASIKHLYRDSHAVAVAAVAAAIAAVDAVCSGEQNSVFCATRPPGHHALNTGREEGFCFYNTIAIAARHAQNRHQREKILIVDWDYHHGNGTEAAFYADPSVLFFSTHDYRAYPRSGHPSRTGVGRGKGYNINVHLNCNATDADILQAFDDRLAPAVHSFKPDLILVSAGFDSRKDDLLGCFDISDQGFADLTRRVQGFADEYCDGCLVSILEGGYSLAGLTSAAVAHVQTLLAP